jgi:hypothetical protein
MVAPSPRYSDVLARKADRRGVEKMTTEDQRTREEKAYGRVLKNGEDKLSEAGRTILSEAHCAAYDANLVHSYSYEPEDCEEAMGKMRLAAADLAYQEQRVLAKVWRAASAAAASIDADDFETLVGYRTYSGNIHHCYRMVSGMIEDILREKENADLRK